MRDRIKEIIEDKVDADVNIDEENPHLKNDLGLNSLDVIEVVMEIEKEFDISIPDEEFDMMSSAMTLNEFISIVEKYKNEKI